MRPTMQVRCPSCQAALRVARPSTPTAKSRCGNCGQVFTVRRPASATPAAAAQASSDPFGFSGTASTPAYLNHAQKSSRGGFPWIIVACAAGSVALVAFGLVAAGITYWFYSGAAPEGQRLAQQLRVPEVSVPASLNPLADDHDAFCDRLAGHINTIDHKMQEAMRLNRIEKDDPQLAAIGKDINSLYCEIALLEPISRERAEELKERFAEKRERSHDEVRKAYYEYVEGRDKKTLNPAYPYMEFISLLDSAMYRVTEGGLQLPSPTNELEQVEHERIALLRSLNIQLAELDSREGFFELIPTLRKMQGELDQLAMRGWEQRSSGEKLSMTYAMVGSTAKDVRMYVLATKTAQLTTQEDRADDAAMQSFLTAMDDLIRSDQSIAGARRGQKPLLVQQREQREQLAAEKARQVEEERQRQLAKAAAEKEQAEQEPARAESEDEPDSKDAFASSPRRFGRPPEIDRMRSRARSASQRPPRYGERGFGGSRAQSFPAPAGNAETNGGEGGSVTIQISGGADLDWTGIRDSLIAATGARSHSLRRSGGTGTISFSYAGDLAEVKELIDFGTITSIDEAKRTIQVKAQ